MAICVICVLFDNQPPIRVLRQEVAQLTLKDPQPAPQSTVFDNREMKVDGHLEQVADKQYKQSAHAEGNGTATVHNYN